MPGIKPQDIPFIRECFDYEPETGVVRWRHRPEHHFQDAATAATWNTKHAGKPSSSECRNGYSVLMVRALGHKYRMLTHRVVWALVHGELPPFLDHINGCRTDNRLVNLRAVTPKQNNMNVKKLNSKFGMPTGVQRQLGKYYSAKARLDGKTKYIGCFDTAEKASAAYQAFVRQHRGPYRRNAEILDEFG